MKPYSPASERNREPVWEVLRQVFTAPGVVLEIGAGTGQHAVYLAQRLAHLEWFPTDRAQHLAGIEAWVQESGLSNLHPPAQLDVRDARWAIERARYVFTANTAHIMSWPEVELMFAGVARVLEPEGMFCLYGPVNRNGRFTSESNREFDEMLRARDPAMGLRDDRALIALGETCALEWVQDHPMPANNRLLVWRRVSGRDQGRGAT